ncbi:MAG: polysaccharide deacetylase family protein [Verrucomicrobiaceae bacterium]|jgi:peptidoglycan/xylan/chitin deacetylase (PgdA/CDA1 family)|nr:polysaccharide deacetylase family protein [Verrucomicrobiaceae bacterium]
MKSSTTISSPRRLKAAALVGSGVAGMSRLRNVHEVSILAWHGVCQGMGDEQVLDWSLHMPQDIFRRVCAFLASNYNVISLRELVCCLEAGEKPHPNAVVLTFDDGYASNFHLAWPVIREFNLPATIFVTTGFLDGVEKLWFQRLDLALGRTKQDHLKWNLEHGPEVLPLGKRDQRRAALDHLLREFKKLPDADLLGEIDRLEHALGVSEPDTDDLPAPMRPMTWDQARTMVSGGLVEIGGHTHTHPILSRCDPATQRAEIFTCRDRITAELGTPPLTFCYPNGGPADYTSETVSLLKEAGFRAACTMENGRVESSVPLFELPRYGSPESVWEAEATVSGAFETVKEWRQMARNHLFGFFA